MSMSTEVPTCHELESRASATAWEGIRMKMHTAVVEMAAMPLPQVCLHCGISASLRCKQCGFKGFYCPECFATNHDIVNSFHVAEKWEVCN